MMSYLHCYSWSGLEVKVTQTYSFFAWNEIEELASRGKFDDHEDIWGCVDKFIVLNYVGVVELPQHFDLALHFFKHALLLYFLFIQYFDGNFMPGNLIVRDYSIRLENTYV